MGVDKSQEAVDNLLMIKMNAKQLREGKGLDDKKDTYIRKEIYIILDNVLDTYKNLLARSREIILLAAKNLAFCCAKGNIWAL